MNLLFENVKDEEQLVNILMSEFNQCFINSTNYENELLLRNSLKLLNRLLGDEATLLDLNTLVWNVGDEGRKKYVMELKKKPTMPDGRLLRLNIRRENEELIDWFLNDYYTGICGVEGAPKTWKYTENMRTFIKTLCE